MGEVLWLVVGETNDREWSFEEYVGEDVGIGDRAGGAGGVFVVPFVDDLERLIRGVL